MALNNGPAAWYCVACGQHHPTKEHDCPAVAKTPPRGSDLQPQTPQGVRTFGTGATRDLDANKLDYEGFLSPLVLKRYAEHMHKARKMPDGSMRDSDNWQLGIPKEAYMKSLWRHFYSVWSLHRGIQTYVQPTHAPATPEDIETELCALLFNASGMLHEILKAKREDYVEQSLERLGD